MATILNQSDVSRPVSAGFKVDISRGQRIGRVSSEWFSRPDDERFLSLSSLHAAVKSRAERATARTVETRDVRVEASRDDAERLALLVPGRDEPVMPTHWSFGQLCSLVCTPAGYGNANDEWVPPNDDLLNLRDLERVRTSILSSDDGLVTMALAARGPEFTSMENTVLEMTRARELGLRITVHVGVGPWCKEPLRQMADQGLLGPDITFVHCNTLIDSELQLLAACGGTSSLSPETELNMGMGDLPTMRMLQHGHRPSLSIDVVSSAPGDIFGVMRTTLTAARADVAREMLKDGGEMDPIPLTSREVFEFATLEGARACGHEGKTGHIAVGYQADIVLLDTVSPNMMPLNYGYGLIVEGAHPGNVDSVFVAGKPRKRNGKLVDVDLARLRTQVDVARNDLFAMAGLNPHEMWVPKPHLHAATL